MRVALLIMPSWSTLNLPLGLATVSAIFRNNGHETDVFDLNILLWNKYKEKYGIEWNSSHSHYWDDQSCSSVWEGFEIESNIEMPLEIVNDIQHIIKPVQEGCYDIIGFSLFASNRTTTFLAQKLLKKNLPNARFIFGGPSAIDIFWPNDKAGIAAEYWLRERDAVIIGEADTVLPELLTWWEKGIGRQPDGVLTYREEMVTYTKSAPSDFYNGVIPDYSDYDLKWYKYKMLPIEITRGCVGKCAFCTEKNLYPGYRVRSIDLLINTIIHGIEFHNIKTFNFIGSAINGNMKHFEQFCKRIIESGIKMIWGGSIRINSKMDSTITHIMVRAGCNYVNTGIESAAPEILKKMNKALDIHIAENVICRLRESGIRVAINIICGFPGETEEHHQQTIEFLRKIGKRLNKVHISPCHIFDGSQLSLYPDRYGVDQPERIDYKFWTTSDGSNDYALRARRVSEIITALDDIGVPWLAPYESSLQLRSNSKAK
jgi:anaerobic magnesium-protoporphyrin IX monomethyl ester cyclase